MSFEDGVLTCGRNENIVDIVARCEGNDVQHRGVICRVHKEAEKSHAERCRQDHVPACEDEIEWKHQNQRVLYTKNIAFESLMQA